MRPKGTHTQYINNNPLPILNIKNHCSKGEYTMFDVLLITGAAGSGKTTTAQSWAASRQQHCAHLSHDAVMMFMKSGLASPAEQSSPEAERQWQLAIKICCSTAQLYAQEGVRCAIDTFLLPQHLVLWEGLAHLDVGLVVLQPPVELALERNFARIQKTGWGVPNRHVYENHAAMQAWNDYSTPLILDTDGLSTEQIVALIDTWEAHSSENNPFFPKLPLDKSKQT